MKVLGFGFGGLGFGAQGLSVYIMENEIETAIVYWGFTGIMEKKREITISGI